MNDEAESSYGIGAEARGPVIASIIINNYNYGRFLADAIDSALAQTWPHKEIIVVDDGSTDNSRGVIESYGERIMAILKPNGGQASALNAGFAQSRGDFVIFLDSDDMLRPDATAGVAEVWRSGVARVQYPLEHVDENGCSMGRMTTLVTMTTEEMRSTVLRGYVLNGSPTSGNAFSREALAAVLPMPEQPWRISADTYLLVLTPLLGNVVTLSKPLAAIRHHGVNNALTHRISAQEARRMLLHDANAFEALRAFLSGRGERISPDWLLAGPGHVAWRLTSLRLAPSDHPFVGDRRAELLRAGLAACWNHPLYFQRTRITYAAWLAALALAPVQLVGPLAGIRSRRMHAGQAASKRHKMKENWAGVLRDPKKQQRSL